MNPSIALLIISFVPGIVMARSGRFPIQTPSFLGGYIIHVPLPAFALLHIHNLSVKPELVAPATMPWILFAPGAALFLVLYRMNAIDRATAGCLILTAGLGNTSFVGLPMIEAYYGKEALGIGIIADQAGTFLMLSTGGIFLTAKLSAKLSARAEGEKTPGAIAALYLPTLADGMISRVTVFEAAMGPMITGGIIAMEQDLNPPLASLMLAVGIALSFLTLPVWYLFMQ